MSTYLAQAGNFAAKGMGGFGGFVGGFLKTPVAAGACALVARQAAQLLVSGPAAPVVGLAGMGVAAGQVANYMAPEGCSDLLKQAYEGATYGMENFPGVAQRGCELASNGLCSAFEAIRSNAPSMAKVLSTLADTYNAIPALRPTFA